MVNVALFVRLEAKPGKEAEVAEFLKAAPRLSRRNRRRLPGSVFGFVLIVTAKCRRSWNQGSKAGNWRIRIKNRLPPALNYSAGSKPIRSS
jgi:hypothetical protein